MSFWFCVLCLSFLGWRWLPGVNSSIVLVLSGAFLSWRISLIHCGSLSVCRDNTKVVWWANDLTWLSTYIVRGDCELYFGLNFRELNPKAGVMNMKTCPVYCSCILLENNRKFCPFLFVFIYLFLEELLIFKWQRKNQYLGESWVESDPAEGVTKMLLCLSNQEIQKVTLYCIFL